MRLARHTAIPLLLMTGACGLLAGGDEPVGRQGEPWVNTGNTTPAHYVNYIIPGIGGSGSFSSYSSGGVTYAPGTYTNGKDLDGGAPYPTESTWNSGLTVTNLTAPNFPTYMSSLTSSASTHAITDSSGAVNGNIYLQAMQTAVNAYTYFNNGTPPPFTITPTYSFYGYPIPKGQWTRHTSGGTNYTDPPELDEQRERGARFYCAARNADTTLANMGTHLTTMGSQAVATVNIFGNPINLLVTQPTVTFGQTYSQSNPSGIGPANTYLGSSADGAQAFEIPLQFGTIFTPIQGLGVPGLPEIRYPVVFTSGDSEAITETIGYFHQDDVTVVHGDTIRAAGWTSSIEDQFTLFTLGPITVSMDLKLGMAMGQANTGIPTPTATGEQQNPNNNRVLGHSYTQGFNPARTGFVSSDNNYDDGWWNRDLWSTGAQHFGLVPGGWLIPAPSTGPTYLKAWQDDDHNFVGTNSINLTSTFNAGLQYSFSGVTVSVGVQGGVSGYAQQDHVVQDALMAEIDNVDGAQTVPVSVLSVRPHTAAALTFNEVSVVIKFNLYINFVFGQVDINRSPPGLVEA